MTDRELTEKVIGCAIEVHRVLGRVCWRLGTEMRSRIIPMRASLSESYGRGGGYHSCSTAAV